MPTKIEVPQEARAELREATRWYRARSKRVAHDFLRDVDEHLRLLADHPKAGARWDDEMPIEVRRLPLRRFPYLIVYVEGDPLRVLAVAYAAREPGYWSDRIRH